MVRQTAIAPDDVAMGDERSDHEPVAVVGIRAGDVPGPRVGDHVVDRLGPSRLDRAADDARPDSGSSRCQQRVRDLADRDDRPEGPPSGWGRKTALDCGTEELDCAGSAMLWRTAVGSSVAEISRPTSASAAISRARRWVSWYSWALRIAAPTFAAIVESSRTSSSPNRPSWWVLWTLMTPIARSPTRIGTPRYDFAWRPDPDVPRTSLNWASRLSSIGCPRRGCARSGPHPWAWSATLRPRPRCSTGIRSGRRRVVQRDVHDVRLERLAHLLADQSISGVEVELRG